MSRLIGKLTQISKGIPKPMGFTAVPSPAKGRMALIAGITDSEGIGDLDLAGADALLLHSSAALPARTLQRIGKTWQDMPWGLWVAPDAETGGMAPAGADYAVFTITSHVAALSAAGKLGKVLKVDSSLPDSALRVLGELQMDALLIADDKLNNGPLSLEQLLLLQRFSSVWSKPVLALMPAALSTAETTALWLAGVDGIVIEPARAQLTESLSSLSKTLEEMGLPPRKRGKSEALVPYASLKPEEPVQEEEEGDDDDP